MKTMRSRRRKRPNHPYPGLRPFEYDENLIFFGREGQVDALINRMRRHHFLAVLGSSGSGKSSLVRAGLLPALDAGRMAGACTHWKIAVMRPGEHPMQNLVTALTPLIDDHNDPAFDIIRPEEMLKTMLESSCFGLQEVAMGPLLRPQENLLVVVDQFEELFRFHDRYTDGPQENEARAFVRLLLESTVDPEIPIYIVITMRSDFLGDCPRFRDLPEAINEGQYLVPRLTRNQLRAAIVSPAAVFKGKFAPDLVIRLLNDIGDNADQLPILQHALMRTWNHHPQGAEIQLSDYEAIGGLNHALNQHAEEIYEALAQRGLAGATEQVFKCLTKLEGDGRGIRRPMRLSDISAITTLDIDQVREVADAFRAPGCSFLMPPLETPLEVDTLLDISHESLMRLWLRLRDWVQEENKSVKEYLKLSFAAVEYQAGRVNLWRQPELGIALKWHEESKPTIAWASHYDPHFELSMRFLEDSHAAWRQEEANKAAMLLLQQKSETQRRNLRRLFVAVVLMIAMLIFSVAATFYALDQKSIAEIKGDEARNNADSLAITSRENGRLYILAEKKNDSIRELQEQTARLNNLLGFKLDTISNQRNQLDEQVQIVSAERDKVTQFSKQLAQTNGDLDVANKDLAVKNVEQAQLRKKAEANSNLLLALYKAAQSQEAPDKNSAAALAIAAFHLYIDNDGPLYDSRIYAAMQRALERYQPQIQKELKCYAESMAYDPKTDIAMVMGVDGTLTELRNISQSGALVETASRRGNEINILLYDAKSSTVVLTDIDHNILIYDVVKGTILHRIPGHSGPVVAVDFLSNKGLLLSCTSKGELFTSNAMGKSVMNNLLFQDSKSRISSIMASPNERLLVVAKDNQLDILRLDNMSLMKSLNLPNPACKLAWSPDAGTLAFGLENGVVGFYFAGKDSLTLASAHAAKVSALSFSPDGNYVASGSYDQTLRLWRTDRLNDPPVVLAGHQDWVTGLGFKADSKMLYSISNDRTLRRWFTHPEELAATLSNVHESALNPK